MPTFNVHVYPIFHTTVRNVEADTAHRAAELAESAVMGVLADPTACLCRGGYEFSYVDGLHPSLVDSVNSDGIVESVVICSAGDDATIDPVSADVVLMAVPAELVAEVQTLLAKRRTA